VVEFGAVGPILEGLAVRLRDMVHRRQLDPCLLGAVEWALDRHHVRAIKVLSNTFRRDNETADCLIAIHAELEIGGLYGTLSFERARYEALHLRLLRILRVVNADLADPTLHSG
jgi:hypothetical protein